MPSITIEIRYATGVTEKRQFTQARMTVGRETGDIVLNDPQVSTRHGELNLSAHGASYVDLGSTNGTYLVGGGQLVAPQPLAVGTELRIGNCTLAVRALELQAEFGPSGTVMMPAASAIPSAAATGGLVNVNPSRADGGTPPTGAVPPTGSGPVPPGGAADGSVDLVSFLNGCFHDYRPHALEGAKVLGVFAIPVAAVVILAGWIPVLGALLHFLAALGYALIYIVYGLGAAGEFALRTSVGMPTTAPQVWGIQFQRLVPWFVGLLVPMLLTICGCIFTIVLFAPMLLPVYMLEQRSGVDVNRRCFEVLKKDWVLTLVPWLLVLVATAIVQSLVGGILGMVPLFGRSLATAWGSLFAAAVVPFTLFVQFRAYYVIRQRNEQADAVALARQQLG